MDTKRKAESSGSSEDRLTHKAMLNISAQRLQPAEPMTPPQQDRPQHDKEYNDLASSYTNCNVSDLSSSFTENEDGDDSFTDSCRTSIALGQGPYLTKGQVVPAFVTVAILTSSMYRYCS